LRRAGRRVSCVWKGGTECELFVEKGADSELCVEIVILGVLRV